MSRRARQEAAWQRHQAATRRIFREIKEKEAEDKAKEKARFQAEEPRRTKLRAKALRDTKGWSGEYKETRKQPRRNKKRK